jgi:flagellar hook assembly protein FlgD
MKNSIYWDGNTSDGMEAPEGMYFIVIEVGNKNYSGNLMLVR